MERVKAHALASLTPKAKELFELAMDAMEADKALMTKGNHGAHFVLGKDGTAYFIAVITDGELEPLMTSGDPVTAAVAWAVYMNVPGLEGEDRDVVDMTGTITSGEEMAAYLKGGH